MGFVWRCLPGVVMCFGVIALVWGSFTSSGMVLLRPLQSLPILSPEVGGSEPASHASGRQHTVQLSEALSEASPGLVVSPGAALLLFGGGSWTVSAGGEALLRRHSDWVWLGHAAAAQVWEFVPGKARMLSDRLVVVGGEDPPRVFVGEIAAMSLYAEWINGVLVNLALVCSFVGLSTLCLTVLVWWRSGFLMHWLEVTVVLFALLIASVLGVLPKMHGGWAVLLDTVVFYGLVSALCLCRWRSDDRLLGSVARRQLLSLMAVLALMTFIDMGSMHLGLAPWFKTMASAVLFWVWCWRLPKNASGYVLCRTVALLIMVFVLLVASAGWSSWLDGGYVANWGVVTLSAVQGASGAHLLWFPIWLLTADKLARYAASSSCASQMNTTPASDVSCQDIQQRLDFNTQLHRERLDAASVERQRIFRDLHDEVGSKLVALLYAVRSGALSQAPLEDAVMSTMTAVKKLMRTDSAPESREIVEAMFAYCFEMDGLLSDTGVNFVYEINDEHPISLLGSTSDDLIQIVRELVANSLKHSGARRIEIRLEIVETFLRVVLEESEYQHLSATVFQDGLRRLVSSGLGSSNLRDRAAELGVRLWVDAQADNRTTYLVLRLWNTEQD